MLLEMKQKQNSLIMINEAMERESTGLLVNIHDQKGLVTYYGEPEDCILRPSSCVILWFPCLGLQFPFGHYSILGWVNLISVERVPIYHVSLMLKWAQGGR